jgi:hypothetical protein
MNGRPLSLSSMANHSILLESMAIEFFQRGFNKPQKCTKVTTFGIANNGFPEGKARA